MERSASEDAAGCTCVAEWFRRRAGRSPERPALTFAKHTWSYGEMQRRIEKMSELLVSGGTSAGDRVAYIGLNHAEVLVAFFATARIGAIFVPLNYRLAPEELVTIVRDATPHTLIADEKHVSVMEPLRDELSCERYLCLGSAPMGWKTLDTTMLEEHQSSPSTAARPNDVVLLLYTSGTTGKPKGVMISNGNIWASSIALILGNELNSRDVTLNCAPLFHAAGLCSISLPTLIVGAHLILQQGFNAGEYLLALERYRVTHSVLVPAMMLSISQQEGFETADLSTLRLLSTGGAPVAERLLTAYSTRGIPVSQSYGLTESTSAVTVLETNYSTTKLGSCGRAGVMVDIRLKDGQGHVITQPYVIGEIFLRGPSITMGYWNRPLKTAESFDEEGWLRTGDGAHCDADGFYYIGDRIIDMIITGGENVYPAEVENILCEHATITEVAIIGGPDERWGERIIAIAALKAGASLSLEELNAFAQNRLARYKLPRELYIVEALPRTGSGKIIKSELRHQFCSQPISG